MTAAVKLTEAETVALVKAIVPLIPGATLKAKIAAVIKAARPCFDTEARYKEVTAYVVFLRVFPQVPDTGVHIELRQRLLARQILANGKAELFDGPKPLRLPGIFLKALQHIESHKGHGDPCRHRSPAVGQSRQPDYARFYKVRHFRPAACPLTPQNRWDG